MGDFKKLEVWQKAHELTLRVYKLTDKLPDEEKYVLTPQLRRAAISYESNLAEGETRFTDPAKLNFFVDSRSSGAEIQTQLNIVHDVYEHLSQEAQELMDEYELLCKRVNSLITYRRNHPIAKLPKNLIANL